MINLTGLMQLTAKQQKQLATLMTALHPCVLVLVWGRPFLYSRALTINEALRIVSMCSHQIETQLKRTSLRYPDVNTAAVFGPLTPDQGKDLWALLETIGPQACVLSPYGLIALPSLLPSQAMELCARALLAALASAQEGVDLKWTTPPSRKV